MAVDALNNLSIALIIARHPHEAIIVADNCLHSHPGNILALATLSVALQEVGDQDRFKALLDYDLLTRQTMIDAPPDNGTLEDYNKALAEHLRTHPTLVEDPKGNATRAGLHSGDLLTEPAGPFKSFQSVIRDEVSAYIKSIPQYSKHPYFAKIPAQFTIDIWGIVLTGDGHQIPHIHPDGWLSGCYYPAIPQGVSQTNPARSGWFEFGKPQPLYAVTSKPDLHPICPREGLLLLFPSFIFHRTIPVQTTEERISIAFDVLPTG